MTVTWNTLKRLFRGVDISFMKMYGYPLDDYVFVAQNANLLLGRLTDGSMPPPPFPPWSSTMIQTFQAWIDGGFKFKDEVIATDEAEFIDMCIFLTGFDDLHDDPELAQAYHQRLNAEVGAEAVDLLINSYAISEADFVAYIETAGMATAQIIIMLWYTGSFYDEYGFAADHWPEGDPNNQWIDGLVWRASSAHPMGYAAEGYTDANGVNKLDGAPYWTYKPNSDGRFTGLGKKPEIV